jgi:hypothetical protein
MRKVIYHFRLADGRSVSLDTTASEQPESAPPWARLEFEQCANCPLQRDTTPQCPMAVALVPLIEISGTLRSHDQVKVLVDSPERRVVKETTVQRAVGSVMGLLAANSGCPRSAFLKPMAHFHLPFASEEETIYRAASTYLLGQYFQWRQGAAPDWELEKLKANYAELRTVNLAMAKRLRHAVNDDGALNALILLDLLAKAMPYTIDEQLDEIKEQFLP